MRRFLALLLLPVFFVAAQPAAAQDDDGGTFLENLIEESLSSAGRSVSVTGFRGALSAEATLERMTISDSEGVWLTLENAKLDWNRSALLRGRLEVTELAAERLDIARAPLPAEGLEAAPAPEASGFSLPELPVSVRVDSFGIDQVTLGETLLGEPVALTMSGAAQLAGGEADANLDIRRTDGQQGELVFDGGYANGTRQLRVNLSLSEGEGGIVARLANLPGQPSLSLTVQGDAPVDDFAADLALTTDGEERLSGNVTLSGREGDGHRFGADVTGDLRPLVAEANRELLGPRQELRANGRTNADGSIELDALELTTAVLDLNGAAEIGGDGWPRLLDVTGTLRAQDGAPLTFGTTQLNQATFELDFNDAEGETFRLETLVQGIAQPTLTVAEAKIAAIGSLTRAEGANRPGSVTGTTNIDVTGIAFDDPALQEAVGPMLQGVFGFDWQPGAPLSLTDLSLDGAGMTLAGDITLSGLSAGDDPTIAPDLRLTTADIARFSALAGMDLSGAADVSLEGQVQPLAGRLDLTVNGNARDLATGVAQLDGLLAGEIALATNMQRDETGTFLRQLEIEGEALDLTANARLQTGASTGAFALTLPDMARIQPGLTGPATLAGTLDETADDYLLDIELTGPAALEAKGRVTASKTETGVGTVSFDGNAGVGRLSDLDELTGQALTGAASFVGAASYDLEQGNLTARGDLTTSDLGIGVPQVDGLIGGTGRASVAIERSKDGVIDIERFDLTTQGIAADAKGSYAPGATDISFSVSVPQLSRVQAGLPGGASLTGDLTETAQAWLLDFTATGPGNADAQGRLSAEKMETGIGDVRFTGNADVGTLSAFAPLTGLALRGAADFDGTLAYSVPTQDLTAEGVLNTRNLGIGVAAADNLIGGAARASFAIDRNADGVISINRLDYASPELSAEASGTYGPQNTSIRYDVALRDLGRVVSQFPGRATATGTLASNGGPWQIKTSATGPGGTQAQIDGTIAQDFGSANLGIDGSLPLGLINSIIEPNLLTGIARLNLRLDGPLAPSSLSGTISVNGGDAVIALPTGTAMTLSPLNLQATLSGGQAQLSVDSQVATGGRLQVSGPISLNSPYRADLSVTVRDLIAEDRRLYQASLDGDLTVQGPLLTGPRVAGRIGVEQAELRIPETGLGPGSRSFTLTVINAPAAVYATRDKAGLDDVSGNGDSGPGYVLPLDITIDAPARIFVRGRGLDAELGGSLRLSGSSADLIAEGRLQLIRGRLDILGQRLTLDRADLRLTGDFDPTLDVVATTERDGTEITVSIEGQASSPEVSFSSNPSRPEEEVLALLLFGRDMTQVSAFQALRIAAAVNTLAGRGGQGIVDKLRLGFGLDDLDVTTDAEGNAGVRLGKYISDNVYTDVEVGSDGETDINLNVQLSPNVKARGTVTSTGNTSLGVFFEKDY